MTQLVKATLQPVTITDTGVRELAPSFAVQFNPSSLRLQRSNNTSSQPGERPSQTTGNDTSLSVDLVFDTADEGTTEAPVDVRSRTGKVAAFVLPGEGDSGKSAPPSVRFAWGSVIVEGVMTSFSEDIDLFSADGVPLRSKVGVTIKEQDPAFMALRRGAGANDAGGATKPGAPAAGPGTGPLPAPTRTAVAIGGESAAQLAARVGLEPAAWRSLTISGGAGLGAGVTMAMPAGARVDFRPGVRASAGAGVAARPTDPEKAAGFAATAAGGIVAGAVTARAEASAAAADANRRAFTTPGRPAPVVVGDVRAETFGLGVPLRPRIRPEGRR